MADGLNNKIVMLNSGQQLMQGVTQGRMSNHGFQNNNSGI